MKRAKLVVSLIVMSMLLVQCAGIKTVEQSSPNPPPWIHGVETHYLIGYARAGTFDEAKEQALQMIKEKTARAVAESISFEAELTVQEERYKNAFHFIENYSSRLSSKTSGLNYLKGISLSKVTQYYWVQKKQGRTTFVDYYIKYPLNAKELDALVATWKEQDKQLTQKLKVLEDRSDQHLSVETILHDLEELQALKSYFVDQRHSETCALIAQLEQELRSLYISPVSDSLGYFSYNLKVGNKYMASYQAPRFVSNCAQLQKMHVDGNYGSITYNYHNCAVEQDNYFQLIYQFNGIELTRREALDVSDHKIFARVNGEVSLKGKRSRLFANRKYIRCHIPVESLSSLPFSIDRIELYVHRCKRNKTHYLPAIIVDNASFRFCGKGTHQLTFDAYIPFWGKRKYSSDTKCPSTVSGKIHYSSEQTREKKVTQFTGIPYFTNW
jgi:hypothetical protein